MRALLGCIALAVAVQMPGVADAQEREQPEEASPAEQLFGRGKDAAAARDWLQAYSLFERSFERHPSYDTAANLGQVALKLKRFAAAADYLSYSLEHFPPSGEETRRSAIERLQGIALERVGVIEVSVVPNNATLMLDGALPTFTHPRRWYCAPGRHTVLAQASGFEERAEEIIVHPKTIHQLDLQLSEVQAAKEQPALPSPPPAQSTEASPPSWRQPLPVLLVGGGVTVVSLAVGIGFGLAADSKESSAESRFSELPSQDRSICAAFGSTLQQCSQIGRLTDEADSRRSISYVGYGLATLAALSTAGLLLWPADSGSATTKATPRVAVGAGPSSLEVRGRF